MKKTLIKTILIVAFLFCSNQTYAETTNRSMSTQVKQIIWDSNIHIKTTYKHHLVHMYSLQNSENLRAYHYVTNFLNPYHRVPTAKDLVSSIQSHPFFIGRFPNEPSHDEFINLKDKTSYPFLIFETYQNGKSDFYIVHSKGVRHFTINTSHERWDYMASLDNGAGKDYPSLESFIKCTLKSYKVKLS